jgi:hypothetical protein
MAIAFALFISVANATAEELFPEQQPVEPAPVVEEAPTPDPAPVVEETPAPAPVVEEAPAPEPVVEEAPAPTPDPVPAGEPDSQVADEPADDAPKPTNEIENGDGNDTSKPALVNAPQERVAAAPVDHCSNVLGNQQSVPNGLVKVGSNCYGEVRGCNVTLGGLSNVTGLTLFDTTENNVSIGLLDIADWKTGKHVGWPGTVQNVSDRNLNTTYWRFTGIGMQTQQATGQQLLDNGCSFTPPAPVDVCDNIAGDQPTVPGGLIAVTKDGADNCVPPAVSCSTVDQDPLDDGSTTNSVAGDGVTDACANDPDALCEIDQTPTNLLGGPSKEACVDNPDIECAWTDQHPEDLAGGPSKEACVDNPPVTCLFDEEAYSAGGSPTSLESCRPIVMPNCTAPGANANGIAIDTNANGNPDTCATLVAQFSCRVRNDDGGLTLHWTWTNPYGVTVVAPIGAGSNYVFGANGQTQTTSFTSGSGTSSVNSGSSGAAWQLTGGFSAGNVDGAPCFVDQCPNIEPGDQREVPAGMVQNAASSCVPAPPTCEFDERGVDNGRPLNTGRIAGDGVVDRCRVLPDVANCLFDETPTNTNPAANDSLDTCVPNPDVTSCLSDEVATDTNGNGSKDTCVPKPPVNCGLRVGADSNGNGSLDTCVEITPIIDCGVYEADGSRTLRWRWRNATPHSVSIPLGARNMFFDASQPTTFAANTTGSFTSNLNAGWMGLNTHTWMVTGNMAIGGWSTFITPRCFPDTCPNIAGDQDGAPAGMAINNRGRCVAETSSCSFTDYTPSDSDADGVNDTCVAVPVTECGNRVPVDTNGNGNPDDCGSVQPAVSCVTNLEDGSSLAYFTWTNANPAAVTVALGNRNQFVGVDYALQPTQFPVGSGEAFGVPIAAGSGSSVTWHLTGLEANATHESKECFTDSCPNLAGDQDGMPKGMVRNDLGACVPQPPTCDTGIVDEQTIGLRAVVAQGETMRDSDGDGVADTCDPVTCDADMTPVDSGTNEIADRCVPKPVTCPEGQDAVDQIPAGAPNGVLDTCVAKATTPPTTPGESASSGTGGSAGDGGTAGVVDTGPDEAAADAADDAAAEEAESAAAADSEVDGSDGTNALLGEAVDVATSNLPLTGAAIGLLLLLGTGAIAAGSGMRRAGSRKAAARDK